MRNLQRESFAMNYGSRIMEILRVDEVNFKLEVLEAALPVLVDFTAAWCGPCKMLDPVVKQLAQEWDGHVKVVKLDIDENQDLTVQYQVMGVPTLMLFVKGQPVQRVSGYVPKDKLVAKFKPFL
jgi:thioredoxin 1